MHSAVNSTVVRLSDRMTDSAKRVGDRLQELTSQAEGAVRTTDGFIRSNPWAAVGALAFAGLATGYLIARGAKRSRGAATEPRPDAASEVSGG